jgi:hypothetical protein
MFDLDDILILGDGELLDDCEGDDDVVDGDKGDDEVGDENDGDKDDENGVENVDEIDGSEDETPDAILAQCLELLNVENNVQLVSMLMRYKQQKDGQKLLLKFPLC